MPTGRTVNKFIRCYVDGYDVSGYARSVGALVETYVAQNLAVILDSAWPKAGIFFWNIQGRHEVDFVIEAEGRCMAIEVKAAARWEPGDLAGLKAFIASTPHCVAGVLAYNGATPVRLGERLWAIPLGLLLS